MTPTTIYRAGDIVLTPFPYADQRGKKKRPVVLLSADRVPLETGLYIACMVTSHEARHQWDVNILAWQEAGLLFPSVVRCPKVFGLDQSLILGRLGRLATDSRTVSRHSSLILEIQISDCAYLDSAEKSNLLENV